MPGQPTCQPAKPLQAHVRAEATATVMEALKHAMVVLHTTIELQRPSNYQSPIQQADRGPLTQHRTTIHMVQIHHRMTVLLHWRGQLNITRVSIPAASWWHVRIAGLQLHRYGGATKVDIPSVTLVVG